MKLRPGSTMSTMFYINYNSFSLFLFFFSLSRCLLLLLFSPLFKRDLRCSVIARSLIIINQLRLILCFLSDIPRALVCLLRSLRMTLNHTNLLNARLAIRQMVDTLNANIMANKISLPQSQTYTERKYYNNS